MSFSARLPAALGGLGYAVARFFWPARMSPDYSAITLPYDRGWGWPMAWLGAAVVASAVAVAIVNARRGGRGWALSMAGLACWFLTSNIPFVMATSPAPRLWHLPLATLCLGVGWAFARLVQKRPALQKDRLFALSATLAVVILLSASWRDATAWRSMRAFAESTVEIFPRCFRAHVNLAYIDYHARDFSNGLAHAQAAVRVFPDERVSWDWVGLNAMRLPDAKHKRLAEDAFRVAMELGDVTMAPRYMADFLRKQGRSAEADALDKQYPSTQKAGGKPSSFFGVPLGAPPIQ
jgi:hypothetical protein